MLQVMQHYLLTHGHAAEGSGVQVDSRAAPGHSPDRCRYAPLTLHGKWIAIQFGWAPYQAGEARGGKGCVDPDPDPELDPALLAAIRIRLHDGGWTSRVPCWLLQLLFCAWPAAAAAAVCFCMSSPRRKAEAAMAGAPGLPMSDVPMLPTATHAGLQPAAASGQVQHDPAGETRPASMLLPDCAGLGPLGHRQQQAAVATEPPAPAGGDEDEGPGCSSSSPGSSRRSGGSGSALMERVRLSFKALHASWSPGRRRWARDEEGRLTRAQGQKQGADGGPGLGLGRQ